MRPPSPRRPGGSRPRDERPSDTGKAGSAFDEIIAPTPEPEEVGEAEKTTRRPVSLVERRRARCRLPMLRPCWEARKRRTWAIACASVIVRVVCSLRVVLRSHS